MPSASVAETSKRTVRPSTDATFATDSTGAIVYRSILESRFIRLDMVNDQVSEVIAQGSANSYYMRRATMKGRDMLVNTARGDTIRFFFKNGSIGDMQVRNAGDGGSGGKYFEYKPAKPDSVKEQAEGKKDRQKPEARSQK